MEGVDCKINKGFYIKVLNAFIKHGNIGICLVVDPESGGSSAGRTLPCKKYPPKHYIQYTFCLISSEFSRCVCVGGGVGGSIRFHELTGSLLCKTWKSSTIIVETSSQNLCEEYLITKLCAGS